MVSVQNMIVAIHAPKLLLCFCFIGLTVRGMHLRVELNLEAILCLQKLKVITHLLPTPILLSEDSPRSLQKAYLIMCAQEKSSTNHYDNIKTENY